MVQQLELSQTRSFKLSHLNPVFSPADAEVENSTALIFQLIEIEINSPDNLALHVRRVATEGKSTTKVIELKQFSRHFIFRDNKHILDTRKMKDFHFDTTESSLKEIEASSKKYKVFKITVHYIVLQEK